MNDEILDEVRNIKEAIAVQFQYDMRALFEEIKKGESVLLSRGIQLIPPPNSPPVVATALQRSRLHRR